MNKDEVFEKMWELSLEDNYNYLCKNKPHRNSKLYKEWDYIESVAYEELLDDNENIDRCNEIIKMIIDFCKKQYEKGNK